MKYIMVILFLVLSTESFSQTKLDGTFCTYIPGGYGSTCIEFVNKSDFIYQTSGCLGVIDLGKGKYRLKKGLLELKFTHEQVTSQSEITKETISYGDNQDSISFYIEIFDEFNESIPGVSIYQKLNDPENKNVFQTSLEGRITIKKPKDLKDEDYKVLYIGYESFEFSLKNSQDQNVCIRLAHNSPNIISNTTKSFPISDIGQDFFVTTQDIIYKKVKYQISSN